MKINKKLSTAIVLSLMMGAYGTASAANLYGAGGSGESISGVTPDKAATIYGSKATPSNNVFTVGIATDAVYGGYTVNGTADGNTVSITGVTIGSAASGSGNVYGGTTSNGNAINNIVNITDAKIGTHSGPATGLVYGGYVKTDGEVTGNKVNISGSSEIYTGVYGGRTAYGAEGDVTSNRVNITGDTTKGVYVHVTVAGGYSDSGLAKDNTVGTIDKRATNFTAERVYGGYGETGAESNDVYLGTGANVTNHVYGGYALVDDAIATKNTVTVVGAVTVAGNIYGNYSFNGDAIGDGEVNVAIINSNIHTNSVCGGYGDIDAIGNTVTINGAGSGDTERVKIAGLAYGGKGHHGVANYNKFGTATNAATNFTTGEIVYGGYGNTGAEGNEVHLGEGARVGSQLYGGNTYSGIANGNSVSINGTATNKAFVLYGVHGGYAQDGAANNNIVGVIDSTGALIEAATNFTSKYVYGGQGAIGAEGNKVWLGTGADVTNEVYGGYTSNYAANNNSVTISGGHIGYEYKDGAYVGVKDSEGNNLGDVFGGYVHSSGDATSNSVIVSAGDIYGNVIGGKTYAGVAGGTKETDGNTVSINGASATERVQITGKVYGGQSANGNANNNKVGLVDSTDALVGAATNFIAQVVYGGYGTTGATGNKVWLGEGAIASGVYGGNVDFSKGKGKMQTIMKLRL